ncbi:MAG: hypothetical protein ACI4KL_03405 [Lentihominibacter sp.]
MTKHIKMNFNCERSRGGFYTVEAAIFLPLFILAVLTIGYFIKIDMLWEETMHRELDSCSYSASIAYSGSSGGVRSHVHNRRVEDEWKPALPLDFGDTFSFKTTVRYRDFVGLKEDRIPLGTEGLESPEGSEPVWIFPQSGTKYHTESCTYVKASVHSRSLTSSVKSKYSPCGMCHSASLPYGSIVFCFSGEDTSYHRGSCRCINRHVVKIDKKEALNKGYGPCSKCGG